MTVSFGCACAAGSTIRPFVTRWLESSFYGSIIILPTSKRIRPWWTFWRHSNLCWNSRKCSVT